jgi:hypothetical protein
MVLGAAAARRCVRKGKTPWPCDGERVVLISSWACRLRNDRGSLMVNRVDRVTLRFAG